MEKENKSPDKVFSCGTVKAAIWVGRKVIDNTVVEVHSIRIDRSYKDKDTGEWRYTTTLDTESLPKVAVVSMEAYKYLRLRSPEQDRTDEFSVDNGRQDTSKVLR